MFDLAIAEKSKSVSTLDFYQSQDIYSLDQSHIVSNLASDMAGYDLPSYFQQFSFEDYQYLLLARDENGSCEALLGMTISTISQTTCLNFVTGFVADRAQGQGLMRRMIGCSALALSKLGIIPALFAARTYNPVWYRMLSGVGAAIPNSAFYPQLGGGGQGTGLNSLATEAVSLLNPGAPFDATLGIIRGALVKTPTLFRHRRPRCSSIAVDAFFHTGLGPLDLVLTMLDLRRVPPASYANWLRFVTEEEAVAACP